MTQYLIMCRSLTRAQTSRMLLERNGITASVVKAPQKLTAAGCGYAVSVYRKAEQALALLKKNELIGGKIYMRTDGGDYTEVRA